MGKLRNGRVAGATGMKAEHLKEWLADMKHEEAEDGVEGIWDCWRSFVTLLQAVWESRTIPTQMTWMIIVLLTKGGGDYHGIWDIVVAPPPEVYRAIELPTTGLYFCPVVQCGGQSGTRFNLRPHVLMRHPQDLVCITIEGSQPLPKCKRCGLQTPVQDLNGGHHRTELYQQGWERKWQHAVAVHSQKALECSCTAYREELEKVEVFKYLGRLIAYDDAGTQAMRSNLRKARRCWVRILRVLRAENAAARTCGMFIRRPCRWFYCMEVRRGICLRQALNDWRVFTFVLRGK